MNLTSSLIRLGPVELAEAPEVFSRWRNDTEYLRLLGDPVLPPGQQPNPNVPRVNNGVTGDPRPSTSDIGELVVDMKVNNAVAEINRLIGRNRARE